MFDGVRDVREWMAAAHKPELAAAATLGSCMQDMMHCMKAGLEGQPNVSPASYLAEWADVNKLRVLPHSWQKLPILSLAIGRALGSDIAE